jgi:tRNA dimethylallyltransferase
MASEPTPLPRRRAEEGDAVEHPTKRLVVIGGPTASGKSGLALDAAEAFGGTVINADSMQVYRDLRILTARPGSSEEARAPHRLYGVLDAAELCSAARWRAMALTEIEAAAVPIVVGGTGLYLRALLEGLAPVPEIPAEIRTEARALHRELGGAAFRARLAERDREGAARLHEGDTQRLVRAYEVVAATGHPLGEWQRAQHRALLGCPVLALVLLPPRAPLYEACDRRLEGMVAAGALEEVQRLVARDLDPALPALKALGVSAFARHLRGEIPLEEGLRLAQVATRQYAKRQTTWFRHQLPTARRIEAQYSEKLREEIFPIIRQFLLTGEVATP